MHINSISTEKQLVDPRNKCPHLHCQRFTIELIKKSPMLIEGRNIKHTTIFYLDRKELHQFTTKTNCCTLRSTTRLLRTGGRQINDSGARLFVQDVFCSITTHTFYLYGADRNVLWLLQSVAASLS